MMLVALRACTAAHVASLSDLHPLQHEAAEQSGLASLRPPPVANLSALETAKVMLPSSQQEEEGAGGELQQAMAAWSVSTEGSNDAQEPSSDDLLCYGARYPDLKSAFGTDTHALLNHWNMHGKREGRDVYCQKHRVDLDAGSQSTQDLAAADKKTPGIFWVHIPKTDTSFGRTVLSYGCATAELFRWFDTTNAAAPLMHDCDLIMSAQQAELVNRKASRGSHSTWFHMPVPRTPDGSILASTKVVTLLRDPAARLKSVFEYLSRQVVEQGSPDNVTCCAHADRSLERDSGNSWGWDRATRQTALRAIVDGLQRNLTYEQRAQGFLEALPPAVLLGCQAKMLLGIGCHAAYNFSGTQLKRLRSVLDEIDFVGLSEQRVSSVCLFHAQFGGQVFDFEVDSDYLQPGKDKEALNFLGPFDGFMTVAHDPDVTLYQFAVERFNAHISALENASDADCIPVGAGKKCADTSRFSECMKHVEFEQQEPAPTGQLEQLNHLYEHGFPSNNLSRAGLLVHMQDKTEQHLFRPGASRFAGTNRAHVARGDTFWGSSLVNRAIPSLYNHECGIVLAPELAKVQCAYYVDMISWVQGCNRTGLGQADPLVDEWPARSKTRSPTRRLPHEVTRPRSTPYPPNELDEMMRMSFELHVDMLRADTLRANASALSRSDQEDALNVNASIQKWSETNARETQDASKSGEPLMPSYLGAWLVGRGMPYNEVLAARHSQARRPRLPPWHRQEPHACPLS